MPLFDDLGFYKRAQIVPSDLSLAGVAEFGDIDRLTVCEAIAADLGVPPRVLDNWLWNRGQQPRYKAIPRHRTRTAAY